MKGHKAAIYGIVWSDKTEIMSCSMDMTIKIWDTELGGYKQEIMGQQSFFDLDYSPLSRTIVTGSFDHRIRLYDPRSTGNYKNLKVKSILKIFLEFFDFYFIHKIKL